MRPKSALRLVWASCTLIYVVALAADFIAASYFKIAPLELLLTFNGADGPAPGVGIQYPKTFGNHYFGDFLLSWWQSNQSPSPWLISTKIAPCTYFPLANLILKGLNTFSYWHALLLFEASCTTVLLVTFVKGLKALDLFSRINFFFGVVVLSFPFISLIDRGNFQFLVIVLLCVGIGLPSSRIRIAAPLCVGLASALKGYPIIWILVFVRRRQWANAAIALLTAFVAFVGPLLVFDGGATNNIRALQENIRVFRDSMTSTYLSFNNSLHGLFLSLEQTRFSKIGTIGETHYSLVLALLLLIVAFVALAGRSTEFELSLLCAAFMILVVDFAGAYVLSAMFVPLLVLGRSDEVPSFQKMAIYSLLVALVLSPTGIPLQGWSSEFAFGRPTMNSLLKPLSCCVLFAIVPMRRFNINSRLPRLLGFSPGKLAPND